MGGQTVFLYLVYTLRTWLQLQWIRFNNLFVRPKPSTAQLHKVVVIGDGMAEGVGDTVPFGRSAGVAGYLQTMLGMDKGIRQRWQVIGRGVAGTGSADWLPGSKLFQRCFGDLGGRVVAPGPGGGGAKGGKKKGGAAAAAAAAAARTAAPKGDVADAEVVVIIVGANDGSRSARTPDAAGAQHLSPAQSVANVAALCDALAAAGKFVFLSPLAAPGRAREDREWMVSANGLLNEYVARSRARAEAKARAAGGGGGADVPAVPPVTLAPNVNNPRYWQPKMLCWDGMHFNGDCYRLLAKEAQQAMRCDLVKIEWGSFRRLIGGAAAAATADSSTVAAADGGASPKGEANKKAD